MNVTGWSKDLEVSGHGIGIVLADISCAIAGGARGISDFRVLADQREAFGQVASVPTAYRTLEEIAKGGARTGRKLTAAINAGRRSSCWRGWRVSARRLAAAQGRAVQCRSSRPISA